ncbi:MAG: cation-translocating P-type ATPase, partial [Bacillota bacterium]
MAHRDYLSNEPWHAKELQETVSLLETQLEQGLSGNEAATRLEKYGPNELKGKPPATFLQRLLEQFKDFLVIILIIAAVVSALVGEGVDALVIIGIVVVNAILGVNQESKAEKSLEALQRMSAPHAKALRDGKVQKIPARELVPGDVVVVEAGDYIPADMRLVESYNLKVEEASLTGESVPVDKTANIVLDAEVPIGDRLNTAFSGTVVTYGRGKGLVTATGMHTQLGLIAGMIQSMEAEDTPLQKSLDVLGKWLGIITLVVCAVVFITGLLRGGTIIEMFMTSISLAVAAIPEGLPAVVTIVLALGMERMVKRHV